MRVLFLTSELPLGARFFLCIMKRDCRGEGDAEKSDIGYRFLDVGREFV